MSGVKLVEIIRKKKGWNQWEMKKAMNRSIQSYIYLEEKAKTIAPDELVALFKISGLTLKEFWALVVEEASRKIVKKTKKT